MFIHIWTNPERNIGKRATVEPLTAHPNKTNRTCRIMVEKKDELIIDVFLWAPSNERASVGPTSKYYAGQFSADSGCRFFKNYRDLWIIGMDSESVRVIRAISPTSWWWWWWYIHIYIVMSHTHTHTHTYIYIYIYYDIATNLKITPLSIYPSFSLSHLLKHLFIFHIFLFFCIYIYIYIRTLI